MHTDKSESFGPRALHRFASFLLIAATCVSCTGSDLEPEDDAKTMDAGGVDLVCPSHNPRPGGACVGTLMCPLPLSAEDCLGHGTQIVAVCRSGAWEHVAMGECVPFPVDDEPDSGTENDSGTEDDAGGLAQ